MSKETWNGFGHDNVPVWRLKYAVLDADGQKLIYWYLFIVTWTWDEAVEKGQEIVASNRVRVVEYFDPVRVEYPDLFIKHTSPAQPKPGPYGRPQMWSVDVVFYGHNYAGNYRQMTTLTVAATDREDAIERAIKQNPTSCLGVDFDILGVNLLGEFE